MEIGTWVRILPTPWSIDCGHAGKLGRVFDASILPGYSDETFYYIELQGGFTDRIVHVRRSTLMEIETW